MMRTATRGACALSAIRLAKLALAALFLGNTTAETEPAPFLNDTKVIAVSDSGNVVLDPRTGFAVQVKQRFDIPGHPDVSATLTDTTQRLEAVEDNTGGITAVL